MESEDQPSGLRLSLLRLSTSLPSLPLDGTLHMGLSVQIPKAHPVMWLQDPELHLEKQIVDVLPKCGSTLR